MRKGIRWNVSDIEETFMTQVNGLLVEHGFWNHLQGDEIPGGPKDFPLVHGGDITKLAIWRWRKAMGDCI